MELAMKLISPRFGGAQVVGTPRFAGWWTMGIERRNNATLNVCSSWNTVRINRVGCREVASRRNFGKICYPAGSNSITEAPTIIMDSTNSEVSGPGQDERARVPIRKRNKVTGGQSLNEDEVALVGGYKMNEVCDRLIELFMTEKTSPGEWRNLLIDSKEWTEIRPYFFRRCSANSKAETDALKRRALKKMAKQLDEVDKSMIRGDELLAEIERNELGLDAIVAKRRKDFTGNFFEHLNTLSEATQRQKRKDEIAAISARCLLAIGAHDAAIQDSDDLHEAQIKFDNILNSSSLDAAAKKIEELAKAKELDSALLLLITKAWAAAKESEVMKQEVKDIMFHLYRVARESMRKLVPDEIHIINRLLDIEDPHERFGTLTKTFAPGDDLELKDDWHHTTPERLRKWMTLLLDAYHMNRQNTMIKEAQKLMNPEVISRLEILKEYVEEQFI